VSSTTKLSGVFFLNVMIKRVMKKEKFLQVEHSLIKDERLSLDERMLMLLVLCNSDTWEFSKASLRSLVKVGDNKITKMLTKLKKCGYLNVVQKQEGNKPTFTYYFFECPNENHLHKKQLHEKHLNGFHADINNNIILTNNIMLTNNNKKEKIKNKKDFVSFVFLEGRTTSTCGTDGVPLSNMIEQSCADEEHSFYTDLGYELYEFKDGVFYVLATDLTLDQANQSLPAYLEGGSVQECTKTLENVERTKVCEETETIYYSNFKSYRTLVGKEEITKEEIQLLLRTGYREEGGYLKFDLKPHTTPQSHEQGSGGILLPKIKKVGLYTVELTDGTILDRREYIPNTPPKQKEWLKSLGYEEEGNWMVLNKF